MDLKNQVAIVTGAGQGIGRATALAFARAGAAVVCVDIKGDAAKAVADEVARIGDRSLAITADLGDVQAIDRMVSERSEERRVGKECA